MAKKSCCLFWERKPKVGKTRAKQTPNIINTFSNLQTKLLCICTVQRMGWAIAKTSFIEIALFHSWNQVQYTRMIQKKQLANSIRCRLLAATMRNLWLWENKRLKRGETTHTWMNLYSATEDFFKRWFCQQRERKWLVWGPFLIRRDQRSPKTKHRVNRALVKKEHSPENFFCLWCRISAAACRIIVINS